MAQMKCSECGQIFDGNLKECPNCGCPASECENVAEADNATVNGLLKTDWANKVYECGALYWDTLTKRYFQFDGRASRLEYWTFVIINIWVIATTWGLGIFVVFIPTLSVSVRRLHDINKSGWWILVPWASVFFQFKKSDAGSNNYGTPSKVSL